MSTSPTRLDIFNPLSPTFLFDVNQEDVNQETDLDRRVQDVVTSRSSDESPSTSSSSSSEPSQKKRKRKEEGTLEKNIRFVAKLEKDVQDYDQEIESLKIRRQQTIDAHNQAALSLYQEGLRQGKVLPPRRILSTDEVQFLRLQEILNNFLLAIRNQNSQSIVIPVTHLV